MSNARRRRAIDVAEDRDDEDDDHKRNGTPLGQSVFWMMTALAVVVFFIPGTPSELTRILIEEPEIMIGGEMESSPLLLLSFGTTEGPGPVSNPLFDVPNPRLSKDRSTPGSSKSNITGDSEELWRLSLGAAVPRGDVSQSGGRVSRLSSYTSKRKGPKRHDGKAFKAGEAGCPEVPPLAKLTPPLEQGDSRLKRIHFVHPPKSGGTTFGQVTIATACEINAQHRDALDCCVNPADWCAENCEPIPDCKAIYGCSLCHCHHIPRMHRMADATYSVTIIRHPMTRYISGFFYRVRARCPHTGVT